MSAARPERSEPGARGRGRFVVYVEGPRDRDILRGWAFRVSPALGEALAAAAVILGGRRPGRAIEHFEGVRRFAEGSRALCVLDRDDEPAASAEGAAGLEFFTWSRRHIESYLLVPDAIRRAIRARPDDPRVGRVLDRHLPHPDDEAALRSIDAKKLLSAQGALAKAFGRPVAPGRLAREMHAGEHHDDIRALFDRMRHALRELGELRP